MQVGVLQRSSTLWCLCIMRLVTFRKINGSSFQTLVFFHIRHHVQNGILRKRQQGAGYSEICIESITDTQTVFTNAVLIVLVKNITLKPH